MYTCIQVHITCQLPGLTTLNSGKSTVYIDYFSLEV